MNSESADLVALIHVIVQQALANQPRGVEGVIVPGSYNPADGTVTVEYAHTGALAQGVAASPLRRPNYPLLSTTHGRQSGPRGGERCTIVPRAGGFGVVLEHDLDDSPGAQAGEEYYVHRNAVGEIDGWVKSTNDGATAATR
jgi:hypothetical protein